MTKAAQFSLAAILLIASMNVIAQKGKESARN